MQDRFVDDWEVVGFWSREAPGIEVGAEQKSHDPTAKQQDQKKDDYY
jgi:hypothetical protein